MAPVISPLRVASIRISGGYTLGLHWIDRLYLRKLRGVDHLHVAALDLRVQRQRVDVLAIDEFRLAVGHHRAVEGLGTEHLDELQTIGAASLLNGLSDNLDRGVVDRRIVDVEAALGLHLLA